MSRLNACFRQCQQQFYPLINQENKFNVTRGWKLKIKTTKETKLIVYFSSKYIQLYNTQYTVLLISKY